MKLIASMFLVAALFSTASAQKEGSSTATSDSKDMAASDCARARKLHKPCVLTFGSEDVTGRVQSPDGTDIGGQGKTTFASLIHLRTDFRAEIIRAAEDL